jgi:predicted amidophosphoribosyltransferase
MHRRQRVRRQEKEHGLPEEERLSKWRCPGVHRGIETSLCPECGEEAEFWPSDTAVNCTGCGAEVPRLSGSCLSHCPARQSSCYRQMVRRQALAEMETGEAAEKESQERR